MDGCSEIAEKANANAVEKASTGSGMGDMSQLASALGQALGPLAQMMQGQQQQPTDPGISDYKDPTIAPAPLAGSSLDSSNPLAGTSIGSSTNPNGTEFKAPKNSITGFTPGTYASGAFDSAAGSGAYGDDSNGSGTGMGAGYTASSGGAGLNSSGASMSGGAGATDAEKAAAAAAAAAAGENYEVNMAGGGGSKPSFLGLKSRVEEDLGAGGESVLGDLGLGEEGARELASNEEPAAGIGEADGNTLFHVIHTKISEIKRRGSI